MRLLTIILNILIGICTLGSCNNKTQSHIESIPIETPIKLDSVVIVEPIHLRMGSLHGNYGGCGFTMTPFGDLELSMPGVREISQINSILAATGLSIDFKIMAAPIKNAFAIIIANQRYLVYDPSLLTSVDLHSGSYWSSMSILAHEIGHHLLGHTLKATGSNPKDELEADRFSGFIIYRLGGSLEEATAAMKDFGNENGTLTHPGKIERIQSITNGWNNANETRYNAAIPPPPVDEEDISNWVYTPIMLIDKENIQADSDGRAYANPEFLYGIITEVDKDFHGMKVHVVKTSKEFEASLANIDGKNWDVIIDNNSWAGGGEMDHASSLAFNSFFVPGRRFKFSITEGFPGCGTVEAGRWHLIYAKALKGDSF